MKKILTEWRRFKENHAKEIITEIEFNNVGELLTAMRIAVGEEESKQVQRGTAATAGEAIVGLLPGGGTGVTVAKLLFDKVRSQIKAGGDIPPDYKNNPVLKALFVEPDMSAVVANNIELQMVDKLEKEIQEMIDIISADPDGNPYDMRLPEMNMTKFLTKFISDEYDGTILQPKDDGTS
jgi:hypothetical protein